MPNGRSINRFFSPRVQGQYIPQFVEEPFPFENAFLVGAGQQKRLDDLMAQATELGQIPTRPIEEDILQRNQIVGGLQSEIKDILGQKGGELGQAARDISRAIARTKQNPFFTRNAAAIKEAERGQEIWDKIAGRGEIPLGIDMSAMETPLQDPATGEWNPIKADIRQKTDWAQKFDDLYGDFKAKKVPGDIKRAPGLPGMVTKEKKVVLTEEDVKKEAVKSAKAFLKTPTADEFIVEMTHLGVSPGAMEDVAANIMTAQWADKIQEDTEVELRGTLDEDTGDGAADVNVASAAGRDLTVLGGPENAQQEYTLSSEYEFSPRKKNGDPYKLIVNPTQQYDPTNFGDVEINPGEQDFMLDKVVDLQVINRDIPELGIKKGQPVPEEGIVALFELLEGDIRVAKYGEEKAKRGRKRKEEEEEERKEEEERLKRISQIKPGDIGKEWFAMGRIQGRVKNELGDMVTTQNPKMIPYRFIKRSIEESTGFVADDALLFDLEDIRGGLY